jgi:thiamine biosynthesis protein ThiI
MGFRMPIKSDPFATVPGFLPTHFIVHYNEVALKGRNRGWFEEMLARNIRARLAPLGDLDARRLYGRLLVPLGPGTPPAEAAAAIAKVFGVAHAVPVVLVDPTLEALKAAAGRAVTGQDRGIPGAGGPVSFAVQARRATKDFPFTSMDIQREVGAEVRALTGWRVDLDRPDLVIRIELVNRAAYLGIGRVDGPGGLPTGVTGKVACLLSGGIDSPVAAYRLLRRGATALYVHFHSHPLTGVESQEKARELAELVQPAGRKANLHLVPFADLQRRIVSLSPPPLRVLLYRRFMMRVAEAFARREGALALVTGENLGQVASQTLENLRSIDAAVRLTVLRPLIGMDKLEIIAEARRIGTYETSIEPHGDCCSYLMPPNPATRSTPAELEEAEKPFDTAAEVDLLVSRSEAVSIGGAAPAVSRKDGESP